MYKTSESKRTFLERCGFTLSNEPEIAKNAFTGTMQSMEVWTNVHQVRLYIHFDDTAEPNYCNLYVGENEKDIVYFSERNLVSELKKHGFDALQNETVDLYKG